MIVCTMMPGTRIEHVLHVLRICSLTWDKDGRNQATCSRVQPHASVGAKCMSILHFATGLNPFNLGQILQGVEYTKLAHSCCDVRLGLLAGSLLNSEAGFSAMLQLCFARSLVEAMLHVRVSQRDEIGWYDCSTSSRPTMLISIFVGLPDSFWSPISCLIVNEPFLLPDFGSFFNAF